MCTFAIVKANKANIISTIPLPLLPGYTWEELAFLLVWERSMSPKYKHPGYICEHL